MSFFSSIGNGFKKVGHEIADLGKEAKGFVKEHPVATTWGVIALAAVTTAGTGGAAAPVWAAVGTGAGLNAGVWYGVEEDRQDAKEAASHGRLNTQG